MALIHDYMKKTWVKAEATFRTELAFAATDAVDFEEIKIHSMQEYTDLRSHIGTASLQGEVAQRMSNSWEGTVYCSPQAAGTAPDYGELLKHAYGVETVVASTTVTYSFSDLLTTLLGLQITEYVSDNYLVQANGAWIEQVQITIKSGEAARYTFSGGFADYGMLLQGCKIGATEATGQTVLTLQSGHGKLCRPGVYVKFTGDDNSGAGYLVTAVSNSADEMTVTPALAGGGLSSGDDVLPNVPSQTLAGTVRGGVNCGLTLGGTAMDMLESTTTLDTGIRGVNNEATKETASRLSRARRSVSAEMEIYYDDVSALKQAQAWDGDLAAVILRAGPNTAAMRALQNFPNARIGHVTDDLDFDEETGAKMTLPIKAHQNSAAADEHTLVYS